MLLCVAALSGCASDRLADSGLAPMGGDPGRTGSTSPNTGRSQAAPVDMAGRWTLSSAGRGQCAMTLGAGALEGTVAPAGGCPGNFFTSRRWAFERDGLVIKNHIGDVLAQLAFAPPAQFTGKSVSGEEVVLAR